MKAQINHLCQDEGNDDTCLRYAMKDMNQLPYLIGIQITKFLEKFQIPRFKRCSKSMDPLEHEHHFCNKMDMAFFASLEHWAFKWFQRLPSGSISSCDKLTKQFLRSYSIQIQERCGVDNLFEVTKSHDEFFKENADSFKVALVYMENLD